MKTKKIIISVIFTFFITSSTFCQGFIKNQLYTTNLNSYVGIWEYTSNSEVFRIVLKMGTEDTDISYGLCLLGDYFYSKNGVVMDSFNETNILTSYIETSRATAIIYASNGRVKSNWVKPNKLNLFFNDKRTKTFTGSGIIELISPTQIHWVLKVDEGVYDNEESKGFSVPTDVIMNKK